MAIKGIISWVNPTQNTDGSAYDQQTQGAGYELSLDMQPATVSLPFAFGTEYDMNELDVYRALKSGPHNVRLRVVNKEGTASAWTNPATFSIAAVPMAPANLAVA